MDARTGTVRARRWRRQNKVSPGSTPAKKLELLRLIRGDTEALRALPAKELKLLSLIKDDPEACRALQLFVKKGYRETFLLIHLALAAFSPVSDRESETKLRRMRDFAGGDPDGIDSAARQFGRVATLVERLNDEQKGIPAAWRLWCGTRNPREQRRLEKVFRELPQHLRSMEKALECRAALVRMEKPPLISERTYCTLIFLTIVDHYCKRNYFEKAASLLRVARRMAGDREKVSGESLSKLWNRYGGHSALSKIRDDRQRVRELAVRDFLRQFPIDPSSILATIPR
jgi:hypothetical protein